MDVDDHEEVGLMRGKAHRVHTRVGGPSIKRKGRLGVGCTVQPTAGLCSLFLALASQCVLRGLASCSCYLLSMASYVTSMLP
jgi:hypothetical protein